MSADKQPGLLWSWFKKGVTSMVLACGGAALMYASPLIRTVFNPGKPLANFSHEAKGTLVTFENRSAGATEGWWDFGDGSPLESFSPQQESISHTYPRPGMFTAKLTVRNAAGDENDRAVSVAIDGSGATTPVVESFDVISLKPDYSAPATFRVLGKVKDADYCIWVLGEDRPVEISPDISGTLDKIVTLREAGYYTFRLVAVGGKKSAEKSQTVFVGVPSTSTPEAMLQVTYEAVRVERQEVPVNIPVKFPPKSTDTRVDFRVERGFDAGFDVVTAKIGKVTDSHVVNPKVEITPDRKKVVLTGELVKTGLLAKTAAPPSWVAMLQVTLERRGTPMTKTSDPVMVNLNVPGTTVLPMPTLPAGWVTSSRKMTLELRDGTSLVYRDSKLPVGSLVSMKSRPMRVTATEATGQIRLDVSEVAGKVGGLAPLGN